MPTDINGRIQRLAVAVLKAARARGERIATAESCTGGLVSAALTDIAGSSDVFERGFVTYSNDSKRDLLGVAERTLKLHGSVSPETAGAMALGALKHARADLVVSITGVAGPGGGTSAKPVGLVHFACAHRDGRVNLEEKRFGALSRAEIRALSVECALSLLLGMLEQPAVA